MSKLLHATILVMVWMLCVIMFFAIALLNYSYWMILVFAVDLILAVYNTKLFKDKWYAR